MEVTNDTGKEVQDMNSVVLTVPGVGVKSKNIGHSKLDEGTGIALAESALKKAEEWTPLLYYKALCLFYLCISVSLYLCLSRCQENWSRSRIDLIFIFDIH